VIFVLLVLLQGAALDAKAKKGGADSKVGGSRSRGKSAAKGGDLKAKLAANEGAAALEKRDFQAAIAKFVLATEADPGTSRHACM